MDVTEVVRGLLAKTADRGCTPEEAAVAAEKAADLITRYNIDIDILNQAEDNPAAKISRVDQVFDDDVNTRNLFEFRSRLAHILSMHLYCRIVADSSAGRWRGTHDKFTGRIFYFGRPHDVATVQTLAAAIEKQIRLSRREAEKNIRSGLTEYRRSFYIGAIHAINERLKLRKQQAMANDAAVRALVVVTDEQLRKAVEDSFGRTIRPSARPVRDNRGYQDGQSAGHRADINGDRTVRGSAPALKEAN